MTDEYREHFQNLMDCLIHVIKENSKELAEAKYQQYQDLQDAGFTEQQAFEIVRNSDLSIGDTS